MSTVHTSPSTTSTKLSSALARPEILAPVGDWEMCRAAVHSGADAIYVGMPDFNARGRAHTFDLPELEKLMRYCHLYGVRVLLAFNVLIFEEELPSLIPLIREVAALAPDAFIVQDIGLARLIRSLVPTQVLHASTQMTVTSAEAIESLKEFKFSRFVLGREVSLKEMAQIKASTSAELEVFVHGALCVAYSGQCLTSESLGGRSANRGQCAQACRLEYDLIVDGVQQSLGDRRYLVSPKDLCALGDVPELIELGINSFKIEGRLKSPAYVVSAVSAYREQVDASLSGSALVATELESHQREMGISYSRGFFNGWMDGVNHQQLVDGRYGSHQGLELGVVRVILGQRVVVTPGPELPPALKAGDGVLFADFSSRKKFGAPIYQVQQEDGELYLSFANNFSLTEIKPGTVVFLNSSPELEQRLEASFSDKQQLKRIPLRFSVAGELNVPLRVTVEDDRGNCASAAGLSPLVAAKQAPLTAAALVAELGALGNTPFKLESLSCSLPDGVFAHNRELKVIRRSLVESLIESRERPAVLEIREAAEGERLLQEVAKSSSPSILNSTAPSLTVLIRDRAQLNGLADLPIDTVYLDFEFGKNYAETVSAVRDLGFRVGIATTRIHKPAESAHFRYLARLKPDLILLRNLAALHYFREHEFELIGDFSLNVTNSLTADWLFQQGVRRLCPSYDLNLPQLLALLARSTASRFEATVHQYMPSFHMEHCVFAAFLSQGTSWRDCGRPCEKHQVQLRDRQGALHPLRADMECRNTMFNGNPQAAIRLIPQLIESGVGYLRVEALSETPAELRSKLQLYSSVISGKTKPELAFESLGVTERYGVTEGQLLNITSYRDRKKAG